MSYNVAVGSGGYNGWKILERTSDAQRSAVSQTAQIRSSRDYFFSKANKIESADDLISDFRLLKIALTAFGLDGDSSNKAFIKKVLESDLNDSKSLANRLSDKRYLSMAKTLSLGSGQEIIKLDSDQISTIFDRYIDKTFQGLVGEKDNNLRLALNAKSELSDLAGKGLSNDAFWYSILGSKPLRTVFEGAFGLPSSFASLDIVRQVNDFKLRSERMLGISAPDDFSNSKYTEKLISSFLLKSHARFSREISPFAAALTILTRTASL